MLSLASQTWRQSGRLARLSHSPRKSGHPPTSLQCKSTAPKQTCVAAPCTRSTHCWRAHLHVLAHTCAPAHVPTPCTCARHCPEASAQSLQRTGAHHQARPHEMPGQCVLGRAQSIMPSTPMSCANSASGHTHEHWLRSPAPCAKHVSIQRTCAAGQPDMHLGQLIVSEGLQSASKLRPGHLNPDGWCDPLRQWRNRGLMWPRGPAHEACRATGSSLP